LDGAGEVNVCPVVIGTLPLAAVSDAFPLLRKVDGVIIVGRVGAGGARSPNDCTTPWPELALSSWGSSRTASKVRRGSLGYDYGYGYGSDEQPAPTPDVASSHGASRSDQPRPTIRK
jgi:hypothetical protein